MSERCALSVIVPARDAGPTICEQLAALAGQDLDPGCWEVVVVVDPATTDDTAERAKTYGGQCPPVVVVHSPTPGHSACRNFGVRHSSAARLAFCDADDVVSPTWVRGIIQGLKTAELVSGPIDLALLNPAQLYRWRREPGWFGPLPRWLGFLPAVMSCNMGVTRATFEAVGGFDEGLATGEDLDLAWRAQLHGATIGFSAAAVVHRRLRTGFASFRRSIAYGTADVELYRRFRRQGLPSRRTLGVIRVGAAIASVPLLALPRYRYGWLHLAGVQLGRIAGSWRNKVLFL